MEIGSDWALTLDANIFDLDQRRGVTLEESADRSILLADSGRSAIRVAVRALGLMAGDTILVPAYVCESVLAAFELEGIQIVFYSVGPRLQVSLEAISDISINAQAILVIDFFGFTSELRTSLNELSAKGLKIIYDISHSLIEVITKPIGYVDVYIASLRKLLPIPDGGLVWLRKEYDRRPDLPNEVCNHAEMRVAAMILKAIWLQQQHEEKPRFREMFLEAEALLDNCTCITHASHVTETLLPLLDFGYLFNRRRDNYSTLVAFSSDWPGDVRPVYGSLQPDECPLGFPIITPNRDELRNFLIQHRVFPPIHWVLDENVFCEFPTSLKMSREILTIPCDHRYGIDEMMYVDHVIKEWGRNGF